MTADSSVSGDLATARTKVRVFGALGLTSGDWEKLLSGACAEALERARLPSLDLPPRLGVLALGVWVSQLPGKSTNSLQDLYSSRLTRKAIRLAGDPSHPLHSFFSLLPSGRRLRSLCSRTSRLRDSPIHQAVRMLNSLPALPPIPILPPAHTHSSS